MDDISGGSDSSTPSAAQPTASIGDLLGSIGYTREGDESAEGSESSTANATSPDAAPPLPATTNPTTSQPVVDPIQQKLNNLEQIIASNPQLRAAYIAQEYGIPIELMQQGQQFQQPQPQYSYQQPTQAAPPNFQGAQPPTPQAITDALEDGEEFNPFDQAQMLRLMQKALNPAMDFINQTKAQEQQIQQQAQQQAQQQQLTQMEQGIRGLFDKELPGFKGLYDAQNLTTEQEVLLNTAEAQFQKVMAANFPREIWGLPQVHAAVVAKIAPTIKPLAARLGLQFNTPQPAGQTPQAKAMAREMYVESSNAVPAQGGGNFEQAKTRGSIAGMLKAIGRTGT